MPGHPNASATQPSRDAHGAIEAEPLAIIGVPLAIEAEAELAPRRHRQRCVGDEQLAMRVAGIVERTTQLAHELLAGLEPRLLVRVPDLLRLAPHRVL
eukprot:11550329-Alexandrium_andersonii.AAC.1